MSFYITLPSDASMNYFPDNTVSKYRTYLPETIKLKAPYEVGLAEVSYPKTWNNLKKEVAVRFWAGKNEKFEKVVIIPKGYYSTLEDLLEMIKLEEDYENAFENSVNNKNQNRVEF